MRDPKELKIEQEMLPQSADEKWRKFERKALEIRRFAGIGAFERLDPIKLAELLNLRVVTLADLGHLPEKIRDHLAGSDNWSGGATQPLPDGSRVIIVNNRHSPERLAATLMEEICHSILGHDPSLVSEGKDGGRSYDRMIEEEAYAVGAAALLPYCALVESLSCGDTIAKISKQYGVTKSLVEYRMRVLELW